MLDDRVCVVCGGGNGIGEETAVAMAEAGATVVVNDLGVDVSGEGTDEQPAEETVRRIEESGGEATAHFGDVDTWRAEAHCFSGGYERHYDTTIHRHGARS